MLDKLPANWYSMTTEQRERWLASYVAETGTKIAQLERMLSSLGKVTVDGVAKKLMFRVLTGKTTGSDHIAHGLDYTKILTYNARVADNLGNYRAPIATIPGDANSFETYDNATYIILSSAGVFVGQNYIITIFHYE